MWKIMLKNYFLFFTHRIFFIILNASFFFTACVVGPNYEKPEFVAPLKFKEESNNWKQAKPNDDMVRGEWWKIFNDEKLNELENKLMISNQNIAAAKAQYENAKALIQGAKSGYFPVLNAGASMTRSLNPSGSANLPATIKNEYSSSLQASWEPDLWGSVQRTVEASKASAQASAANLAVIKLSAQSSLAQYYFGLKSLDANQITLDTLVKNYKASYELVKGKFEQGLVSLGDVLIAETQYKSSQTTALDNQISRSQYEHAIAVLIGEAPAIFSLAALPLTADPPEIPAFLPSELLERRPDIAQAERNMASANAQIGVAIAAFFPKLNLSSSGGYVSNSFSHWFNAPSLFWSLGPGLALSLFDGGLKSSKVDAAKATYQASVANYKQTILVALQETEDQLVALNILQNEKKAGLNALESANRSLEFVTKNYELGIAAYTDVMTAQNVTQQNQKILNDINARHMLAAINLIKALGGGWNIENQEFKEP